MTTKTKRRAWQTLTKVPKITLIFWIIKIISTGMGEATSDALVNKLSPAVAVILALLLLAFALKKQFAAEKYNPITYWFSVIMVAVFGTMAADSIHIIGVPYIITTSFYAIVLAIVFRLWYKSEGTLSIHSIHTKRREAYYWLTVLSTFALGTALGDLFASTFSFGFFTSGLIFIGIFLIPTIGYFSKKFSPVFTFWFAYIVTRPLGASFADWLGKPKSIHGLNLGDATVSIALTIILIVLVGYVAITHEDNPVVIDA
jgi:uncharacterized membrane-anchored protein